MALAITPADVAGKFRATKEIAVPFDVHIDYVHSKNSQHTSDHGTDDEAGHAMTQHDEVPLQAYGNFKPRNSPCIYQRYHTHHATCTLCCSLRCAYAFWMQISGCNLMQCPIPGIPCMTRPMLCPICVGPFLSLQASLPVEHCQASPAPVAGGGWADQSPR